MNAVWAAKLPGPHPVLSPAAALRQRPDVEVRLTDDGALWLRGPSHPAELDLALRSIPGLQRFTVDTSGIVRAQGRQLPAGRLPPDPWHPIGEYFEASLPVASLAGWLPAKQSLAFIRAKLIVEANLMLCDWTDWASWAESAATIRLDRLSYAAAFSGRTYVRGQPLPSIGGLRLVEEGGVATEAGWASAFGVDAATVRTMYQSAASDLIVLRRDGHCDRIREASFVPATRASVRATTDRLQRGVGGRQR